MQGPLRNTGLGGRRLRCACRTGLSAPFSRGTSGLIEVRVRELDVEVRIEERGWAEKTAPA